MRFVRKLPKVFYLLFLLLLALFIDFLIFATTAACPGCSSFGQFLTSSYSLTGPVLVSLAAFFPRLTKVFKTLYTKK